MVLETATQTTMLQGGSVYQFRGFPYLDFTGQDARFRTIIAALNGNDPNNGTLCFGLNCAHYLAEQGAAADRRRAIRFTRISRRSSPAR